jgi:hypothetical protein
MEEITLDKDSQVCVLLLRNRIAGNKCHRIQMSRSFWETLCFCLIKPVF